MIQYWNTLIDYLAAKEQMNGTYDLAILAGNSLPYLADELLHLYEQKLAAKVMLVGGIGHATPFLAKNFRAMDIDVGETSETEMYLDYFKQKYGVDQEQFLVETRSANSGENASFSLAAVKAAGFLPKRVLLLEDPILQRRLKATFEKEWQGTDTCFTNAVPAIPYLKTIDRSLSFEDERFNGLWSKDYFFSLALGEIPRLRNDSNGYGPKGTGYIGEVDIPAEVEEAYQKLSAHYPFETNR
jgi:hypothetical protein